MIAPMSEPSASMDQQLDAIAQSYPQRFEQASTEQQLRDANARLLGKKGELTALLKQLGALSPEQRKEAGAKINALKAKVEQAFEQRLAQIARAKRDADLQSRCFDLTLPGRVPVPLGHAHPVIQTRDELLAIFKDLGFVIAEGPQVELEENNFTKLAFPPDHPATDMQDSFWVGPGVLLRTHTSNVQIREMSAHKPPLAVVSAGVVYRRDDDVTHSPMFHQIEGFMVDEKVSFAHLKGVLTAFAKRLYGPQVPVRFRPSYFPFVEPGAEMDAGCVFCSTSDAARATCRVCKGTGWLELLGCGMVHPKVLENCGIDSERYTGFAFGLGIDRVALLRYGIPDIRLLFENDPRFLAQF
jgi:phenylalanyl-tRNA synthetase alpha chain